MGGWSMLCEAQVRRTGRRPIWDLWGVRVVDSGVRTARGACWSWSPWFRIEAVRGEAYGAGYEND